VGTGETWRKVKKITEKTGRKNFKWEDL